jgi:iron(III) transport system permease protein
MTATAQSDVVVTRSLSRPDFSTLLPAGIALLIAYLTLVPIGMMVIGSVQSPDGSFTFRNYQSVVTSGTAYRLMLNSLIFAVGGAAMGTVIGAILAWLVERTNMPGRRFMFVAAVVPLIMPGSLATFAWVLILSPTVGVINVALQNMFGFDEGPLNVYNMPGMIMVEGIHLSTLSFLMIVGALRSMDPSLEEASSASGAGIVTTARRITLPLLVPALASTLLIGFVRAVEGFEVPAMLGLPGRQYVLASQIYLALKTFPINYGAAGVYSTLLFVIGAAGVLIYLRLVARGAFATVSGKGYRPRVIDLRRWRYPALAFSTVYILALFVLPALMMVWASFQPYYAAPGIDAAGRMSLANYVAVFRNSTIVDAAKNSLLLAVFAATIVVMLSAVSAWITMRTRIRGRQLLDVMAFVPIAIPGLVLGVAMVDLYAASPLPIYGTLVVLIITYVIKFLPYGMRSSTSTIVQVNRELEEASSTAGGRWWHTFTRVLLPLLWPGLFAAWVYIFIVSTRELSSSIILAGPRNTPLAVLIYQLYTNGDYTVLSALGVVMVVVLAGLVLIFQRLGGRPTDAN